MFDRNRIKEALNDTNNPQQQLSTKQHSKLKRAQSALFLDEQSPPPRGKLSLRKRAKGLVAKGSLTRSKDRTPSKSSENMLPTIDELLLNNREDTPNLVRSDDVPAFFDPEMEDHRLWRMRFVLYMFHPAGNFRGAWNKLIAIMILFSVMFVPLQLCFYRELFAWEESKGPIDGFDRFVDACFLAHIIIHFRTAKLRGRRLIVDSKTVALSYLRCWFWIDLLASFPYSWVIPSTGSSADHASGADAAGALRTLRLLRLSRLLRVTQMARVKGTNNWMRLAKLGFYVFMFAHWLGCAWWFQGAEAGFPSNGFSPGSIQFLDTNVNGTNLGTKYIYSFFWGLSSLCGVGAVRQSLPAAARLGLASFPVSTRACLPCLKCAKTRV